MFERYNRKAQQVVSLARASAGDRGGASIAPEDILLGILEADAGLFRPWLRDEAQFKALRDELRAERSTGGAPRPEADCLPLSAAAKRIFLYAAEECERLGAKQIRPSHLLAAVLREPSGAAVALGRRGVEIGHARTTFVLSPGGQGAGTDDLHRLIDELSPAALDRARAFLLSLAAGGEG